MKKHFLNCIFVMVMLFVLNSCGTKKTLTPLLELPADYSLTEAKEDGVAMLNYGVMLEEESRPLWNQFLAEVGQEKETTLRFANIHNNKGEYSFIDLSYQEGMYTYSYVKENQLVTEEYQYISELDSNTDITWVFSNQQFTKDDNPAEVFNGENRTINVQKTQEEMDAEGVVTEGNLIVNDSYLSPESISIWENFLEKVENNQETNVRIIYFENDKIYQYCDISYQDGKYTFESSSDYFTSTLEYLITWDTIAGKEYVLAHYEDVTIEGWVHTQILSSSSNFTEEDKKYIGLEILFYVSE